jgi:hypothetical protein
VAVITPSTETVDPRYDLVYKEARHSLDTQNSLLSDLRTRAVVLISVSAAIVAFVTAVGLLGKGVQPLPVWVDWVLVGEAFAVGACVIAVLWPDPGWTMDISPEVVIKYIEGGDSPDARSPNQIYRATALYLEGYWNRNQQELINRFAYFQVAIGLLLVEAATLIAGLTVR